MHGGPKSPNGGPLTDLWEGGYKLSTSPFNYEGRPIGYVIMRVQNQQDIWAMMRIKFVLIAHSSTEFCTPCPNYIGGHPPTDWAIATLKESKIDEFSKPLGPAIRKKAHCFKQWATWVLGVRADVTAKTRWCHRLWGAPCTSWHPK